MMRFISPLVTMLDTFASALMHSLPSTLMVAAVFTAVGFFAPSCNAGGPWWRKRGLATDLAYLVVFPGVGAYARILLLTSGLVLIYHIHGSDIVDAFKKGAPGPLSHMPFAGQVALYLLINDFMMYATHRLFHGHRLWPFHAPHHSSEDLEWISANRFHPVDVMFHSVLSDIVPLLLGIAPNVLVWLVPFTVGTSALVHANLNWDFGPFRYVLASPVFHRWHHTGVDQGGERNFAGTFPFIDLLFGTFYMPAGQLPERYGTQGVPSDFAGQILHPFRRARAEHALPAE
jgi:sterol desaturase/sphingolipid hydroxylase (fatty acid hydroxylase superfamily)